jgi:hypothetical protein
MEILPPCNRLFFADGPEPGPVDGGKSLTIAVSTQIG